MNPEPSTELTALIEKFVSAVRDQVLPDDSILARATPRWEYRNCHSYTCIECSHSRSSTGGKGHGPYLYLYWKEHGKLRKKYIGKDPENYFSKKLEKCYSQYGTLGNR